MFLIKYREYDNPTEKRNTEMSEVKEFFTNVFAKEAYKQTADKFAEMRLRAQRVKRYNSLESLLSENPFYSEKKVGAGLVNLIA